MMTRLFFALLLLLLPSLAAAQAFPKLAGPVSDAANIIPDAQEAALVAKLTQNRAKTGREFVVATVAGLDGYAVSDYGNRLFRYWKLGDTARNDGLLLLIAPAERQMSIETGYGLEPIIPDAVAHAVIQRTIRPRFKANDYPGGIAAGVDALIFQLQLTPEEAAKRAKALASEQQSGADIGAVMFWLFILFFFVFPIIMPLIFGRKMGRRIGSGPVIIWSGGNDWGRSDSGFGSGGFGGGGGWGGGGSSGGGGASGGW